MEKLENKDYNIIHRVCYYSYIEGFLDGQLSYTTEYVNFLVKDLI